MAMRSAKFTAPEKEVEKTKTVQLDQNTVNKRIADFKAARGACLVPKNRPSLLTQFTPEEIMVLGMRNGKLKFLTDEDYLTKYDEVEKARKERLGDSFAPYLSRDNLRLIEPKTVAYIYGYNLADTCTTNDMEVAAALMRGDAQGLQNLTEYDDHVIDKLNEAFKVRDLSVIKRMLGSRGEAESEELRNHHRQNHDLHSGIAAGRRKGRPGSSENEGGEGHDDGYAVQEHRRGGQGLGN